MRDFKDWFYLGFIAECQKTKVDFQESIFQAMKPESEMTNLYDVQKKWFIDVRHR